MNAYLKEIGYQQEPDFPRRSAYVRHDSNAGEGGSAGYGIQVAWA